MNDKIRELELLSDRIARQVEHCEDFQDLRLNIYSVLREVFLTEPAPVGEPVATDVWAGMESPTAKSLRMFPPEPDSRSVLRRKAMQKDEPMPEFSGDFAVWRKNYNMGELTQDTAESMARFAWDAAREACLGHVTIEHCCNLLAEARAAAEARGREQAAQVISELPYYVPTALKLKAIRALGQPAATPAIEKAPSGKPGASGGTGTERD